MKRTATVFVLLAASGLAAGSYAADNGLIKMKSSGDVAQTAQRLEKVLKEKGATVVANVDHAAAAAKVGMKLRPTRVVIFGNPKAGTPLMQCAQSIGIDLPQKALIWEDDKGQAWIGYNDMQYLAGRHDLGDCDGAVESNAKAMKAIVSEAAGG